MGSFAILKAQQVKPNKQGPIARSPMTNNLRDPTNPTPREQLPQEQLPQVAPPPIKGNLVCQITKTPKGQLDYQVRVIQKYKTGYNPWETPH